LKPVLQPGKEYSYTKNYSFKEKYSMKNKLFQLSLSGAKINRQHVQFVLTLIALALLVLGIGAPMDGGGING
jgi:hypothetical protein